MSAAESTVGLLHYPWGEDYGVEPTRPRTPWSIYRRGLAYKANPRSPGYMEALFAERYPKADLVRVGDDRWPEAVRVAGTVVLLYPDSTGLGFRPLERELRGLRGGQIRVLNGRRREFILDRAARRGLILRRVLERSYLGEGIALAVLGVLTPLLVVFDLLRGRR
jgi:hypothetical protein